MITENDTGIDNKTVLGLHCNFQKDKVNDDIVHKFVNSSSHLKFDSVIFVVYPDKTKTSESDKQMHYKSAEKDSYRVELFKEEDLLYNVLRHDLVPKHTILKDSEKADILAY